MPTLAGFQDFVTNQMQVPTTALPVGSQALTDAYCVAMEIANDVMAMVAPTIYTLMVYNLAGDALVNFAIDIPPSTYFAGLRSQFNINSQVNGIVSASSDEGTSQSLMLPDLFKEMTLADLNYLKTPWGRQYLAFAQRYGTAWGLS